MGSSQSFDTSKCPSGVACLEPLNFTKDMQNAFRGDYKQVASGFWYDLWGKKNPTEYLCSYDVFGARTCGYEIKFKNEWKTWAEQIRDPTYKKTTYEQHAEWRYSEFAISHSLTTNGADTGVCMISNKYGTVCLLRDAGDTDMVTYRLSRNQWAAAAAGNPTEATLAANIKASGAGMSVAAGSVDWMDVYHCDKLATNHYVCSAFQPNWKGNRRSEGFPRFGPEEAKNGELSFTLLTGSSSTALAYGWYNMYDDFNGSLALSAGAALAATAMLLNF